MRRRYLLAALGAGALFAGLVAGCGGDDSPEQVLTLVDTTAGGGALTKADFIDEADAICSETDASIAQLVESGEGYTGAGEIADLREGALNQLKQLDAPSENRAALDRFLTALEAQVAAGRQIAVGIQNGEDTSQAEADLTAARDTAAQAAQTYGFKDCGGEINATSTGTTGGGTVTPSAPSTPAPSTPAPSDSGGGSGGGGGIGVP